MGVIATCDWCGEVVETSEMVRLDLKGAGRSSDWHNGTGWVSIYHSKGPDSCVRHVLDLLDMMHTSRAEFRATPVTRDLGAPAPIPADTPPTAGKLTVHTDNALLAHLDTLLPRTKHVLFHRGIKTVGQLRQVMGADPQSIEVLNGIGAGALQQIEATLLRPESL